MTRLRDLESGASSRIDALPPLLARRARHIVTENERVLAAVAALRTGDLLHLGKLFAESHASMRDDYEISTPEVDALVDIGRRHPNIFGARLTGGGFGGAVVMLAKTGRAREGAVEIQTAYRPQTNVKACC